MSNLNGRAGKTDETKGSIKEARPLDRAVAQSKNSSSKKEEARSLDETAVKNKISSSKKTTRPLDKTRIIQESSTTGKKHASGSADKPKAIKAKASTSTRTSRRALQPLEEEVANRESLKPLDTNLVNSINNKIQERNKDPSVYKEDIGRLKDRKFNSEFYSSGKYVVDKILCDTT